MAGRVVEFALNLAQFKGTHHDLAGYALKLPVLGLLPLLLIHLVLAQDETLLVVAGLANGLVSKSLNLLGHDSGLKDNAGVNN